MVGKLDIGTDNGDYAFDIRAARANAEPAPDPGGIPGQQDQTYGPFMTHGLEYFVRTPSCQIGLDISDDDKPDIWMSLDAIDGLTSPQRQAMRRQLQSKGCP